MIKIASSHIVLKELKIQGNCATETFKLLFLEQSLIFTELAPHIVLHLSTFSHVMTNSKNEHFHFSYNQCALKKTNNNTKTLWHSIADLLSRIVFHCQVSFLKNLCSLISSTPFFPSLSVLFDTRTKNNLWKYSKTRARSNEEHVKHDIPKHETEGIRGKGEHSFSLRMKRSTSEQNT